MRIPTTTGPDPILTLDLEETDTAEPQKQMASFPFQEMPAELGYLVRDQCDIPTRCSFKWTCQLYYADGADDFNCFAFADKCAELGYRALLQYSVEQGGPFDEETSKLAAAHGHVDILKMYASQHDLKGVTLSDIRGAVMHWALEAAKTGREKVLNWLQIDQWQDTIALGEVAFAAIEHGHLDLSLKLIHQATTIDPSVDDTYRSRLLRTACNAGHLEAVQKILQLVPIGRYPDWGYFLGMSIRSGHVPLISWFLEGHPELETEGAKHEMVETGVHTGNVELLQLAERHGASITIDRCHPSHFRGELPRIQILKYLHEKFDLRTAPFKKVYAFLPRSKGDVQWMEEHGYQFKIPPNYIEAILMAQKMAEQEIDLPWLLQLNIRPEATTIHEAAKLCRVDLLDLLWQVKDDALLPDSEAITEILDHACSILFIERCRLKPLLKTINWLLSKGYTFDGESCDCFVLTLLEKKPGLLKAYWAELKALNMPLSPDANRRITDFMAKKQ